MTTNSRFRRGQTVPRLLRPQETLLTLLLVTSIALVVWRILGMNRQVEIPTHIKADITTFNDAINGGRSIGLLKFVDGRATLDCQIVRSNTFAFCGLHFALAASGETIDLSAMDRLILDIDYTAQDHDTLLIYILNQETHLGKQVTRSNQLTVIPDQGRQRISIDLDQLFVPSWWLYYQEKTIPTGPNISQAKTLQISTGDNTLPRNVEVTVHAIRFEGKWIGGQQLAIGLVLFWTVVAFIRVIQISRQWSRKYYQTRSEAQDLTRLNQFLKVERDRMENLAKNDSLTGALNRHGLRDVLTAILKNNDAIHSSTSLILLDIDHFKHINDAFGHEAGDRVLVNLARLIQTQIRDTDHLIRWGGEEFAIICANTSAQGARHLADNLRERIESSTLLPEQTITASFGVAKLASTDIEAWFKQADEALYQAKAAGRNIVVEAA